MTGRRLRRFASAAVAAVGVVTLAVAAAGVAPAGAAGAGGIEVTPMDPGGAPTTAFHVRASSHRAGHITFVVRNVSNEEAAARVYAASGARTGTAYAIGGAGSAPWIDLPSTVVRLAPGEARRFEADVRLPATASSKAPVYGAVVEEPLADSVVVRRVATLVYVDRAGDKPVARPVALLVLATVLVGTAVVLVSLELCMRARPWRRGCVPLSTLA